MKIFLTACLLLLGAATATAGESKWIPQGRDMAAPSPYRDFCRRYPAECRNIGSYHGPEVMSARKWKILRQTNRYYNNTVHLQTDQQTRGQHDYWSFPVSRTNQAGTTKYYGDCEDYVIAKRHELIQQGFDPANLSITMVKRRKRKVENHVVLTIRTTKGDFILDDVNGRIRLWHDAAEYLFLSMQSTANPMRWVLLVIPAKK